jgi:hypothetical protein
MTMNIVATEICASKFMFHKEDGTYSAEASELKGKDFFSRVWNDACDVGFQLVSVKNPNHKQIFTLREVEESEGDIKFWVFAPYLPKFGFKENTLITIFND